jgi:Glyoxalase-like domain
MRLRQTLLDCTDPHQLAEFHRQLLGWPYRPGDEAPAPGEPDPNGDDWDTFSRKSGRGSMCCDLRLGKIS